MSENQPNGSSKSSEATVMLGGAGGPVPVVPPVVQVPTSEKTVMAVGSLDSPPVPPPAPAPPPVAVAAPLPPLVVSGSGEKTVMAVGALEPAAPPPGSVPTIEIAKPKAEAKSGSDARTAIATGQSTPALAQGTKPTPKTEVSEVTGMWGPGQGPRPGMTINQYELIRELGAGGMGTVYLARDTKLGRKTAIKIL